jgi:RimJ/RimL family protein N-acetyltransferase
MSPAGRFDTLSTARLLMRRWRDSDREPFAALNGDPQTMRFFPAPISRAASDALIDRIESCFDRLGYGLWALEVAATGEFIGCTGLNPMPDDVPGAGGVEIGWRLARRAWHHGYATEAARAALGVAFDGASLDEIWSMTAVLNQPSQAVMRRLGMTEVARFAHPRMPPGHPLQPHVTYHLARPQESPPAATRPDPVSQAVAPSAHARTRSTAAGGTA